MDIDKLSLNQKNILELFDKEQFLSVGKIAKLIHIPHPTAKQSLNRLLEYKLVGRQGIGKGTFYHRIDENVVLDTFGNKMVKVYQGKDAFTHLFDEIAEKLKKNDYYWSFAFKEEYYEMDMRQFFINFHDKITNKCIEDKTIVHQSVKKQVLETYKNIPKLQIKFTKQNLPTGMSITKNMVVNLIWDKEPIAIAIFLPLVVKRYQDFFRDGWRNLTEN